jgi:hypothetical protein
MGSVSEGQDRQDLFAFSFECVSEEPDFSVNGQGARSLHFCQESGEGEASILGPERRKDGNAFDEFAGWPSAKEFAPQFRLPGAPNEGSAWVSSSVYPRLQSIERTPNKVSSFESEPRS